MFKRRFADQKISFMIQHPYSQHAEVALSMTLNPALRPWASLWCLSVCVEHFDIIMTEFSLMRNKLARENGSNNVVK